jgi:cytochrome c553
MLRKFIADVWRAAAISALVALPAFAADDIENRVEVCAACHGQNGTPTLPVAPVIWGQQAAYLYKELHDYHSADRTNDIMTPLVKDFSLADLRAVANYFAAKSWPAKQTASASVALPEGASACQACHGKIFEGAPMAPRLAGLSYDYLIGAMNAFADGQRTNNDDMQKFMKGLSGSQREAIAHYLAAL